MSLAGNREVIVYGKCAAAGRQGVRPAWHGAYGQGGAREESARFKDCACVMHLMFLRPCYSYSGVMLFGLNLGMVFGELRMCRSTSSAMPSPIGCYGCRKSTGMLSASINMQSLVSLDTPPTSMPAAERQRAKHIQAMSLSVPMPLFMPPQTASMKDC